MLKKINYSIFQSVHENEKYHYYSNDRWIGLMAW